MYDSSAPRFRLVMQAVACADKNEHPYPVFRFPWVVSGG
jgi:hypothetical protein